LPESEEPFPWQTCISAAANDPFGRNYTTSNELLQRELTVN
jgi:hypothetical protein